MKYMNYLKYSEVVSDFALGFNSLKDLKYIFSKDDYEIKSIDFIDKYIVSVKVTDIATNKVYKVTN
tara:strand:+ start:470 stop:667 length:198 start_codon:yes stop_codon:yes gene_type:complete